SDRRRTIAIYTVLVVLMLPYVVCGCQALGGGRMASSHCRTCWAASGSQYSPRSSPLSRSRRCRSHASRTSRPATTLPSTTSRAYWVTGSLAAFRLATAPELLVLVALVLLAGQGQPHPGRRAQAEFGQVRPKTCAVVPQHLVQRVLAGQPPFVDGRDAFGVDPLGRFDGDGVVEQRHGEGRAVNSRQEAQPFQFRGQLVPLSPRLFGQPVRAGRRHRLGLGFCFGQRATAGVAGQHFQVRWFWFASTNSHGAHPLSSLHALWKLGEFRAGASAAASAPRGASPGRISSAPGGRPPAKAAAAGARLASHASSFFLSCRS